MIPKEDERDCYAVALADPAYTKDPIDTPVHHRAASSYINHKDNASTFDPDEA